MPVINRFRPNEALSSVAPATSLPRRIRRWIQQSLVRRGPSALRSGTQRGLLIGFMVLILALLIVVAFVIWDRKRRIRRRRGRMAGPLVVQVSSVLRSDSPPFLPPLSFHPTSTLVPDDMSFRGKDLALPAHSSSKLREVDPFRDSTGSASMASSFTVSSGVDVLETITEDEFRDITEGKRPVSTSPDGTFTDVYLHFEDAPEFIIILRVRHTQPSFDDLMEAIDSVVEEDCDLELWVNGSSGSRVEIADQWDYRQWLVHVHGTFPVECWIKVSEDDITNDVNSVMSIGTSARVLDGISEHTF